MTKKSTHRNYIKGYNGDINAFINEIIVQNKNFIFLLISDKLKKDAEKDLKSGKNKIASWGENASRYAKEIHILFGEFEYKIKNENIENFVEDFINMDYKTLGVTFDKIGSKFENKEDFNIIILIEKIKIEILKMREVSKEHTIIKNR